MNDYCKPPSLRKKIHPRIRARYYSGPCAIGKKYKNKLYIVLTKTSWTRVFVLEPHRTATPPPAPRSRYTRTRVLIVSIYDYHARYLFGRTRGMVGGGGLGNRNYVLGFNGNGRAEIGFLKTHSVRARVYGKIYIFR